MTDNELDGARLTRLIEINTTAATERETLEARVGKVWTTDEMSEEFQAIGFMAPYIVVTRKADGVKGSLEFQHHPRFYFNWSAADTP